jgi:hypothetical protein
MWEFLGYILVAVESPMGAVIVLVILSAFGYGLYKWIHREPKAPGAEQHISGASGGDATR